MKKSIPYLLVVTTSIFLFACSKQAPKEEVSAEVAKDSVTATVAASKSAESLDTLTSVLLKALASKDKALYMSYCFSQAQEEAMANLIMDAKKKRGFQREFGFSLHEEAVYFENIVNYIDKMKIDLSKIERTLVESFDYNKSSYTEVTLKEVIIPVIQEGIERDIVYVAVQIDGKWYFTSELSL